MDAVFLSAVLAEGKERLEGARVARVGADGPEGLVLEAQGSAGRVGLRLGWEAWGPRWYLGPEPPRGGGEAPFAAAVARALRGGRITGFVRPGMERAVGIEVERRHGRTARRPALWAFLWPAGRNAVLVDRDDGTVIAAARPGPWRPGVPFAPPQAGAPFLEEESAEGFALRLRPLVAEGSSPEEVLARAFPTLGPLLAREIVFRAARARGSGTTPEALCTAFREVAEAVHQARYAPRIVLGPDGNPQALSALALRHVPADRQRAYPTAGAAAEAFFAARRAAAEDHEARAWAARALRQARERALRRIQKLEAELAAHGQAAANRQMGEILVAHQRGVARGANEARLPDPYGPPGATRTIPLDPSLSGAANAARYFKLARRGARGQTVVAERLAASRREVDRIADLAKELADAEGPAQVRGLWPALERLHRVAGRASRVGDREAKGQRPASNVAGRGGSLPRGPGRHPLRPAGAAKRRDPEARAARRFLSTDGLAILVGRNNAANDELTLHIARPDDLWLHVEGYGGSHVVIRRGGRAEVPRQTLVEAAQLAAYYSQARGQRKVPVHATLRKHVRKPKGAKPGLVTITHEQTIFTTSDAGLVRRLAAAARAPED